MSYIIHSSCIKSHIFVSVDTILNTFSIPELQINQSLLNWIITVNVFLYNAIELASFFAEKLDVIHITWETIEILVDATCVIWNDDSLFLFPNQHS